MKITFLFPTGYDVEELYLLNRMFVRKSKKRRIIVAVIRVLLAAIGAGLLWYAAELFSAYRFAGGAGIFTAVLSVLIGLYGLFAGIFYFRYRALVSRRTMLKNVGELTISLEDKVIWERREQSQATIEYGMLTELWFREGAWFLYADERHAVLLPEKRMTVGTHAEVERYLTEKTGLPIRYVNEKEKN